MNVPKFLTPIVIAGMAVGVICLPTGAPGAAAGDQPLVAALQELQTQQLTIAANQAKIDVQLAAITEDLRVARLYVARAGGKKKTP